MWNDSAAGIVLEVSLKSCPEYLPRIRKIAACLAEASGADGCEAADDVLGLTEACADAMGERGDLLSVVFRVSPRGLAAEISGPCLAPALIC